MSAEKTAPREAATAMQKHSALKFTLLAAALLLASHPARAAETGVLSGNGAEAAAPTAADIVSLKTEADKGDAGAQYKLGLAYADGAGVDKDPAIAAQWFRKAALQGNAPAQSNLGFLYQQGQGVQRDPAESAVWFRKAAERGFAVAQYNLGLLYHNGQGVKQDYALAAKWTTRAARQGLAAGQSFLGMLYFAGHGVEQNYREAYFWLLLGAGAGEDDSLRAVRDKTAQHLTKNDLAAAKARAESWHAVPETGHR
jgi:TPR repeat protein